MADVTEPRVLLTDEACGRVTQVVTGRDGCTADESAHFSEIDLDRARQAIANLTVVSIQPLGTESHVRMAQIIKRGIAALRCSGSAGTADALAMLLPEEDR